MTRVPPKAATAGKIAPRATCKEIALVSTHTGQAVSCKIMSLVTRKLWVVAEMAAGTKMESGRGKNLTVHLCLHNSRCLERARQEINPDAPAAVPQRTNP